MSLLDRRPALRWGVPAAAVVVVAAAGVGIGGAASADDHPDLPSVSAQTLLTDVQQPTTQTLQGTVSVTMRLGLPDLSDVPVSGPGAGAGAQQATLSGLLAGTHTVRVWSDGPERSRVAVLGGQSESDVVRDGTSVWVWSSADRTAVHATLPSDEDLASFADRLRAQARADGTLDGLDLATVPSTPQDAARAVLDAVGPTTTVATDDTARVAGRPAYTLTLTPKTSEDTLVREVAVDVDAATHVPLRVQVWSVDHAKPAVDVGFTDVSFATPPASMFRFTPPADATVTTVPAPDLASTPLRHPDTAERAAEHPPTVVGDGWDAVVVGTLDDSELAELTGGATTGSADAGQVQAFLDRLPTTSGAWGSGHVLSGSLFTAVLTDDGRVAVGAVPVDVLTHALAAQG